MQFTDRHQAGKELAKRLLKFRNSKPVVLALPRGGVPVGFEVATALGAPLDLVLVRKIGAPDQSELAIGAIADGEDPELVTDTQLIADLGVSQAYLDEAKSVALLELERRRRTYLGDRGPIAVAGHTAIMVDDGIATGATMLAAVHATKRRGPRRIVLAVPVASSDALARLRREVDEVVCLETPRDFFAVGQFYHQFHQLRDSEVISLLDRSRSVAAPSEVHK